MKVAKIKSAPSFEVRANKSLGIQAYGHDNAYPQKVQEIVGASGTGLSCLRTYARFVYGRGFLNTVVASVVANGAGETFDQVLKKACDDYCEFGGFALHVNYNAAARVTEIAQIPFEHCRFEAKNKDSCEFHRVGVYDDWTHRDPDRKALKKEQIDFIELFDPRPEVIAEQVAAEGGWENYKGQVVYFSGRGDGVYPAPIYEPELTNMRSEEGVDNVVGRNVTSGFMPSAALISVNGRAESREQFDEVRREVGQFVGDENSSNLLMMEVESTDDIPRVLKLQGENYDKAFSQTQSYLPGAIGRSFTQPPILRAEDVSTGFSTNEMVNAYQFYNTQTDSARQDVAAVFARIFKFWHKEGELSDATIMPLSYNVGASQAEQMGRELTNDMIAVIMSDKLTTHQKVRILRRIYGLDAGLSVELVKDSVA